MLSAIRYIYIYICSFMVMDTECINVYFTTSTSCECIFLTVSFFMFGDRDKDTVSPSIVTR